MIQTKEMKEEEKELINVNVHYLPLYLYKENIQFRKPYFAQIDKVERLQCVDSIIVSSPSTRQ